MQLRSKTSLVGFFALALVASGCNSSSTSDNVEDTQDSDTAEQNSGDFRPDNPGVTDTEVTVGMNAVFSGPSTGLGVELWKGAWTAFQEANDAGGVHGRKVKMILGDDRYEASTAAATLVKLVTEENVFNTGWSVGTPTIVKFLPVVQHYHESENLFHFGSFTGAQPQRNPPYKDAVFNVRASYREETGAMVDAFVEAGRKKIGVFIQDDAYGADGREGTILALKKHNLSLVADARYPRGQSYDASNKAQVELLKAKGVDAVIMVGSYQACAGFIRDARLMGWNVPVHNVSFVGADQLLNYLLQEEKKTGKKIVFNIINTQVVPHYDAVDLPMVAEYRKAMDKYKPTLPPEAQNSGYQPTSIYSFGSLEGYVTARIYLKALANTGKNLTREAFIKSAEGLGEFDIGLGTPAHFSADEHQALHKVWFTHATANGWKPTESVAKVIK